MMQNILKTAVAAVVPVMLMGASAPQRAAHAIIDRAVAVTGPICSPETCDADEGICESTTHYHLPVVEEKVSLAVARETDPRATVAVALAH